jgi:hypothetical protein
VDEFRLRLFTAGEFILGGTCDAIRLEAGRSSVTVGLSHKLGQRNHYLSPGALDAELADWDSLNLAFQDGGHGRICLNRSESSSLRAPFPILLRALGPAPAPPVARREPTRLMPAGMFEAA